MLKTKIPKMPKMPKIPTKILTAMGSYSCFQDKLTETRTALEEKRKELQVAEALSPNQRLIMATVCYD